ncbi:MAG: hypothetical protein J6W70_00540 [Lentisphaeria bacterium]|nr:hypothetical protein [Lentisphaeria bacterium]
MVKQAGRKRGAAPRRSRAKYIEGPGIKRENEVANSAKRVLAFRRLWLFLLTAALVAVGLMSAFGSRLF